jgi:hypothetical protein
MKNIHLLPTDKSRLYYTISMSGYNLKLSATPIHQSSEVRPQHIYITSDEFIEERDFALNLSTKNIVQYDGVKGLDSYYKKIVLTTDPKLIKDGVQAIPDEFLELFVKNPSCESVEIVKEKIILGNVAGTTYTDVNYKIIIPQEEPKQERMYSEQEVKDLIEDWTKMASGLNQNFPLDKFNIWFEQFKK